MAGQKRAAVTKLFKDLENSDTKVPRVQYLFCQSSVVKNRTRLKTHIEHCLSCPKLLKQKFVDESCKIMNENGSEESVVSEQSDVRVELLFLWWLTFRHSVRTLF